MTRVPAFDGYALDLDGTVYLGDDLLPGAGEAIAALRAAGARIVFVTNKPLETAADYAAKLTRLGVPAEPQDVVTAVDALVRYLHAHHAGRAVLLIAEEPVTARLRDEGFPIAEPGGRRRRRRLLRPHVRLRQAARRLPGGPRAGAAIVATNPDPYCPTPDGGLPDCAAMLAALEACTGARAEAIVGKPSEHMAAAFLDRLGVARRARRSSATGSRPTSPWQVTSACRRDPGPLRCDRAPTDLDGAEIPPDHVVSGIHELVPAPEDPSDDRVRLHADPRRPHRRRRARGPRRSCATRACATWGSRTSARRRRCSATRHGGRARRGDRGHARGRLDEPRGRAALGARGARHRRRLGPGRDERRGGRPRPGGDRGALLPVPRPITGHPSVLSGAIDEIAADAARLDRDRRRPRRGPARLPARDRRRRRADRGGRRRRRRSRHRRRLRRRRSSRSASSRRRAPGASPSAARSSRSVCPAARRWRARCAPSWPRRGDGDAPADVTGGRGA